MMQARLRRFSGQVATIVIRFQSEDDWAGEGPENDVANVVVSSSTGMSVNDAVEWMKDLYRDEFGDFRVVHREVRGCQR